MPKAKRNEYTGWVGCAGEEAVVMGMACGVAVGFSDGFSGKIDREGVGIWVDGGGRCWDSAGRLWV